MIGACFDPSLVSQKARESIVSKMSIVCLFRCCCQVVCMVQVVVGNG